MKTAQHFDEGKPNIQRIPYEALAEIATVFDYGAKKYGSYSQFKLGMAWMRLAGSSLRHIYRWIAGEDIDPESKCSHLAHAACCIIMLIYYEKHHPQLDDRKEDI
jgi:hypothetical protein